ncbi:unnamed protein product [Adineta steineri]|uniref:Tetratricopeptide repeat protein 39B-like protein n=1 Tax=Adineta steineri TaxID=433720 RepID=A0A815S0P0_9BILA|nr:unnamed protein product [Adineta steineri]CAF1639331.1 unnamed protein product [Adineta steineri]
MRRIFEDALESLDDDDQKSHINKSSTSSKSYEESGVDLNQSLIECEQITQLIFENRLNEALKRTKEQENRSLYHSLCHSSISFMQAGMTFNQDDIEASIQALRHTTNMSKKSESYRSWISFGLSTKSTMTEYELHAKLVYAEALLIRALLTFIQDQGLFNFISGALKIKECHDLFVKLAKNNDPSRFSSKTSYEHFDSGVRMGNGAFNLMIANLPQRIIRCLEFAGFSGDKDFGIKELEKSAMSKGLRAPLAALLLLGYHTYAAHIFGNGDGDLNKAHTLVEYYLSKNPNSYLFLVFRARLQTLHCRLNEAIQTYEYAIRCQSDWKNLHHIAYWEILWCHVLQLEWKQAATMAEILLKENNWSKATSCYLLATFQFEYNNGIATDEISQLYKRVPELKIRLAGKSIPLEKYAIKQCEHFLAQKWLFLPALELVYLMNGFYILVHDQNKLQKTLDIVNNAIKDLEVNHQNDQFYADSYGSGLLLRGVLHCFLHRYDEAHQALDEIINMSKEFDEKSLLTANALLEKAMVYIELKQKQKANEYLQKAIECKEYQLESRLHFRINAAMQKVKRLDNESNKRNDSNK